MNLSDLPERVHFEGSVGLARFRVVDRRAPRKGEFYLSGAIMSAYLAPNDLGSAYIVVEPTEELKLKL